MVRSQFSSTDFRSNRSIIFDTHIVLSTACHECVLTHIYIYFSALYSVSSPSPCFLLLLFTGKLLVATKLKSERHPIEVRLHNNNNHSVPKKKIVKNSSHNVEYDNGSIVFDYECHAQRPKANLYRDSQKKNNNNNNSSVHRVYVCVAHQEWQTRQMNAKAMYIGTISKRASR